MNKLVILGLSLGMLQARADCPSIDGNWSIHSTLNTSALNQMGIDFSSSVAHIRAKSGTIHFIRSLSSALDFNPVTSEIGVLSSGLGKIYINPNNCQITFKYQVQASSFSGNAEGSSQGASTLTARGKGAYVQVTRGFAGKMVTTSNGLSLPGTFEMSPE